MHWLLSPVDALLFPAPKATYSTTAFPWPAANCLWLEDPATGNRFPAVVCEPTDGTPPVRVILYCHGNACDAAGDGKGQRDRIRDPHLRRSEDNDQTMVMFFDEDFQLLDHPRNVRRLRRREERTGSAHQFWSKLGSSSGGSCRDPRSPPAARRLWV
jgi:hypothetical protein